MVRALVIGPLRAQVQKLRSRASERLWMNACDVLGEGAEIVGRPHVENLGRIEIGRSFTFHAAPVTSHLVTGHQGVLRIGDRVSIAHGAAIAAHKEITIGDGTQIGPFVMMLDTDFHEAGNHGAAGESRPIRIGANVRIGSRVSILRGATIGDGAEIRAGSVVAGEIPAGAVAGGVPARVGSPGLGESANSDALTVPQVVMRTFGMSQEPPLTAGPDQLEGWTSLGALNLLLSLEETFGVSIRPEEMVSVRRVADLVDVVERARARR